MYNRRVRRSVLAVGFLAVFVLAGVLLLRPCTSSRPSNTGSGSTEPGKRGARPGTSSASSNVPVRRVAGSVYLDDVVTEGATVRLVAGGGAQERSARTDRHGHFEFGSIPVDAYQVIAEVQHATGAEISIDLSDPLAEVDKLRLVAHACEASLHGVVRDASGGTIAKARILVTDYMSEGPGVDAGVEGAYDLCVPVGDSGVLVRADGYADAYTQLSAFGRVHRDFQLVPEAVVSGRTVRAGDGAPVANAQVIARAEDFSPGQGNPSVFAVSDADGRFRLRGAGAGRYQMTATADHLASAEPVEISAELTASSEDLVLTLGATLSLSGRVVDRRSTRPIPDVRLWAVATLIREIADRDNSNGWFVRRRGSAAGRI